MNTLGLDLHNEDILFFLASPSNNSGCHPHRAFRVLGALPDDSHLLRSLPITQGHSDSLSHFDR